MKHTFILDENVYIQSHTCRNIHDSQDNFSSMLLIGWMLRKCHKIGLNNELKEKYQKKSKILEKKGKSFGNVAKIWNHFLYRTDKHRWCDNHLKDLPLNLLDDQHVIELAIFLNGVLVTTDEKLKDRLTKWAEKKGYSLTITSPADVLKKSDSWHSWQKVFP
jgi:hypothetical protein